MSEIYRIGVNPAYCGSGTVTDLLFMTRQQWLGYNGAPENYYLAVHAPFRNRNGGVGIDMQRHTSGPFVQNGLFLSYAYEVRITNESRLRFGLRSGINTYRVMYSSLFILDPGDYLFEQDVKSRILPNAGFGLLYTFKNVYMEFSAPLLVSNELAPAREQKQGLDNREARMLHVESGISMSLSEGVVLEPAVGLWLNQQAPAILDLRTTVWIKQLIGIGLTYRLNGAFAGSFTYRLKESWLFSYAYEIPVGIGYQATSGTHELAIGVDLQFQKSKTVSPRRF